MTRPKSPDLFRSDASRLERLTEKMRDPNLSPAQKAEVREKRAQLMLSLNRAGYSFATIGRHCDMLLTVVREQIMVQPRSVKSVAVRAPKTGERVVPEPLPRESDYGTLSQEQVYRLKDLTLAASKLRGTHARDAHERISSELLDVALAWLVDEGHLPTDIARALNISHSLVRLRSRRGKRADGSYAIPKGWEDKAQELLDALSNEALPDDEIESVTKRREAR